MNKQAAYTENVDKAAQSLFSDIAEIYKSTASAMEEMFFIDLLTQAREIKDKLGRINSDLKKRREL